MLFAGVGGGGFNGGGLGGGAVIETGEDEWGSSFQCEDCAGGGGGGGLKMVDWGGQQQQGWKGFIGTLGKGWRATF